MRQATTTLAVATRGAGLHEITRDVAAWVGQLLGAWWLRRTRREEVSAEPRGRTGWGWTWLTAFVLALPGLYRLMNRLLHPILNREDVTDAAHLAADMASTAPTTVLRARRSGMGS